MKKLFVYGLSIALVAGAASCKKSSKGKLSNEWNVASMEQTTTETTTSGGNTDTEVSTVKIDGTALTVTSSTNGTANDPVTGTVNSATYTISKDGTWSSVMDVTISNTIDFGGGVSYTFTTTSKTEDSGTWDFMNGVSKDFKKNERVVFNTLSSKSTETSSSDMPGDSPSTDSNTSTYAEGENSMVFVIVESKKKELQLTAETNNTYTTDGYSNKNVGSMSFTLTQE